MSEKKKDNRRTGRPSSGNYGTTENIQEYRRSYYGSLDPEKLLKYRLRQAYKLLTERGLRYGYSVTYRDPEEHMQRIPGRYPAHWVELVKCMTSGKLTAVEVSKLTDIPLGTVLDLVSRYLEEHYDGPQDSEECEE